MKHAVHIPLSVAALALVLGCAAHGLQGGGASTTESQVRRFLATRTRQEKRALMAPGFRSWFLEVKGDGEPRDAYLAGLGWDLALHATETPDSVTTEGRVASARFLEANDFSRLIGFPGWNARVIYTVDDHGLIASQVYLPLDSPSWKPYLENALPWLRSHHAAALSRIYAGDKLVRNADTAREWVRVLRDWRRATGQPDPTRN